MRQLNKGCNPNLVLPQEKNEKIYHRGLTWVISQVGMVGRKSISQPSLRTSNLLLLSLIKDLQCKSSILIQNLRILRPRRSRPQSTYPYRLSLPKKFLTPPGK